MTTEDRAKRKERLDDANLDQGASPESGRSKDRPARRGGRGALDARREKTAQKQAADVKAKAAALDRKNRDAEAARERAEREAADAAKEEEANRRQKLSVREQIKRLNEGGKNTGLGLDDSFSRVAILRGLVGQRGPTEPVSASCAHDDLLPYALPPLDAFARCAVPVRLLLESSPDPTDEDVRAALRTCAAVGSDGSNKRRKLNDDHDEDTESPAAAAEALALLRDNYALIGHTPADALPAERHGVEMPHEARWMPEGPRGESMARVAVLEHAIARCTQVAARADTGANAAEALRRAAAVLKFGQMEELYALNEAAEFEDDPHPLGTAAPLVTRPCAMVRGTLSSPTDAGVCLLSTTQLFEEGERPLSGAQALQKAMGQTAVATASLRHDLRR
jgi:hypothetical protein